MENTLKWVYGNTLPLVVKLWEITAIPGGFKREEYIAPGGSIYTVRLVGKVTRTYACEVSGNTVTFTDDGTIPIGIYGVEVCVAEPNRKLRTFKCCQIEIVNCSQKMDIGDLLSPDALSVDSEVFFWAKGVKGDKGDKGDKGEQGDPLTYEDLTPAQKEDLTQNCYTKVPRISIDNNNGITETKQNASYPVAHPDMGLYEKLLPQRFERKNIYEKVVASGDDIPYDAVVISVFSFNRDNCIPAHAFKNDRVWVIKNSANIVPDYSIVQYYYIS